VGPRACLDTVVKIKIRSPRRESNPRTLTVQPVHKVSLKFVNCFSKTIYEILSNMSTNDEVHSLTSLELHYNIRNVKNYEV
jgi:hypothetical protein